MAQPQVKMVNPKEPEGHREMVCNPDQVSDFEALGWQVAKAVEAAASEPSGEDVPADARRKPRKVAEQS